MAPSTAPSKRNALRDHASLLRHLHRASTSSISTGLLSPTARPPSSPTSPLSPVPPSSTFTLFPLQPSTLPAEPQPFTLEDDILACADRLARDLDAKKQPALDESSRRRKRRRLEGLHKEHARPLVVSTVCVLEGTLEELAARTKKSSWKLDRKSKRERREKVSGWEEVLLAMGSLQGLDDRVKERTRARLERLYGASNTARPLLGPSVPPVNVDPRPPRPGPKRSRKSANPSAKAEASTRNAPQEFVAAAEDGFENPDDSMDFIEASLIGES